MIAPAWLSRIFASFVLIKLNGRNAFKSFLLDQSILLYGQETKRYSFRTVTSNMMEIGQFVVEN